MKRSNLMATLVTLGLATAAATPALALENQFSGAFTSFYDLSNYTAAGNLGDISNAEGLKDGAPTENYFVQRVRLGYTAKANEDVRLVTRFELDYAWYGNSSYTIGRNSGGGLGADSVNIETKNLYLDLNLPKSVNAKIGMMGFNDSFKGILFDADMAGVLLSHEYAKASVKAGFFRFADSTNANTWAGIDKIGRYTNDMFALDAKYRVNDTLKVGAAYYYIDDNRSNGSTTSITNNGAIVGYNSTDGTPIYGSVPTITTTVNPAKNVKVHTVGLNAETSVGPVTLTGFALAQFGDFDATSTAKGYAFNIGAKMPLAGGTARSEFLYTSGGKNGNSLYVPASPIGAEGGGFYDAEMVMLNRDKNAMTVDTAIVYDSNNFNQGLIMGSLGYDYTFTPKLSGSANAGFAAVAKNVNNSGTSDYLGTEINCEANYQLMSTVTVGARAGYVFLGDYFKNIDAGKTPDNPYDIKLIAKYSF